MSTLTIRYHDPDNAMLLVDGKQVLSVSNFDADGGRAIDPSVVFAARVAAEAVALALGADVEVVRP